MGLPLSSPGPVAVVVLGVHRSGTSALTGCLRLLGVPLGEPLLPPEVDNQRGFWELEEIVAANERLLAAFGGSHLEPPRFPDGWLDSEPAREARRDLGAILRKNFAAETVFAVKDPRICLLLPLWKRVLSDLGVEPGFVVTARSPWEVAKSLEERNGLTRRESEALYLRHYAEAERETRGARRLFTTYERILSDPVKELERIGASLAVAWPVSFEESRSRIEAFVAHSLRHWKTPARDAGTEPASGPGADAHAALLRLVERDETDAGDALQRAGTVHGPTVAGKRPVVLFVSHDASRSGAPRVALDLVRWLSRNAALDVRVLLRAGGELEADFRAAAPTAVATGRAEDRQALDGVSLVFSNTGTNGPFLEALGLGKIPVLTHVLELEYSLSVWGLEAFETAFRQSSRIVTVSRAVEHHLVEGIGVPAGMVAVLDTPVDVAGIRDRARPGDRERVLGEIGVASGTALVVGCGIADWRKGADLFVQLGACLERLRPLDSFALAWVGPQPSALVALQLEIDVRKSGLAGKVFFVGPREDAIPWLNACDVVALTSREDPLPLVVLEAGVLGKPVVCFAGSGGAADLCVETEGPGFAAPYLDTGAMARQVDRLLADPARGRAAGASLAGRVAARHDLATGGPAWARLIERVLGDGSGLDPAADGEATVPASPAPGSLAWLRADVPGEVARGESFCARIAFRNDGADPLSPRQLAVSYHWSPAREGEGEASWDGVRTAVRRRVQPGAVYETLVPVRAPAARGEFILAFDLVREGAYWFSLCGVPPASRTIRVV